MKRAMILFCLMALTATAWGRHLGRTPLEERYDRFKDRTTVTTQRVLLSSGFRNLGIGNSLLSFTYGCPGQEAKCQPESVIMLVETVSSGTWLFINCNELIFLADGARIAIGAHWDGGIASGKEWMIGEITP